MMFVSGQWTVPDALPAGSQVSSSCATWVGIGGFFPGGGLGDLMSLIQAGTDQDVFDFAGVQLHGAYAWWEEPKDVTYRVSFAPERGWEVIATYPYRTWLPPSHRDVVVLKK